MCAAITERALMRRSPLRHQHESYLATLTGVAAAAATGDRPGAATGRRVGRDELETIAYGPGLDAQQSADAEPCEIVALFDAVETEYGSLRRGAGLMDCPHRGTLIITGQQRVEFLNRMLTQQFADATDGAARESFLVSRKGRIIADLLIAVLADRALIDVDVHQAAETAAALEQYLFAEDVQIRDATEDMHRIAVHGPNAAALISEATGGQNVALELGCCASLKIADVDVAMARRDQTGDPGLELFIAAADAPAVWQALLDAAEALNDELGRFHRPVGWHAWNIARIEAGTPMMNIDFDTTSLPHETGVVASRVSFRKGCYPGQEIVARMQNLGGPKQRLAGLRIRGEVLPVAGTEVFSRPDVDNGATIGEPVGVITSSTLSPMLGAQPIALAMLRTKNAPDGATVMVAAEGEMASATVGPMQFWSRESEVNTETQSPRRTH